MLNGLIGKVLTRRMRMCFPFFPFIDTHNSPSERALDAPNTQLHPLGLRTSIRLHILKKNGPHSYIKWFPNTAPWRARTLDGHAKERRNMLSLEYISTQRHIIFSTSQMHIDPSTQEGSHRGNHTYRGTHSYRG